MSIFFANTPFVGEWCVLCVCIVCVVFVCCVVLCVCVCVCVCASSAVYAYGYLSLQPFTTGLFNLLSARII